MMVMVMTTMMMVMMAANIYRSTFYILGTTLNTLHVSIIYSSK